MVKKILAIDGGGMYGVVTLEVCLAIEKAIGKPLRDIFDLFVGTSTGSLISAAALSGLHHDGETTTFGFSAPEIIKAYEENGKKIFSAKRENIKLPGIDLSLYPKYDANGLRTTLNKLIGERKIGWLNDRGQHISISAYNMSKGKPYFFRSWVDRDIYLRDAVMASSSAPTTHPMYKIGSDFYTDGGVFAVNPAPYALADGLKLWRNESLVIVSLGTGKYEPSLEPPDSADEDSFWWLKNLSKIFTDGQNESVHEAMIQISQEATWLKYFRFDVNLNQKKKADELDFNVLNKARKLMNLEINGQQKNEFERTIQVLK
jgi:uncharacterized protein